ncbi:MAG: hypothetical protein WBF95_09055 [Comamonas thiooxydans]
MPDTTFSMTLDFIRASAPLATLLAAVGGGIFAYKIHKDKVKHENEKELAANVREQKLASVLVSDRLAVFIRGCQSVSTDDGYNEYGQPAGGGRPGYEDVLSETTVEPSWDPSAIPAQWKYLDANLVDQLFKLSLLVAEANGTISWARIESGPPEYEDYFAVRQEQYAALGLRAISLRSQVIANAGLTDEGMPLQLVHAAKSFEEIKAKLAEAQRLKEERHKSFQYMRDLQAATSEIAQAALIGSDEAMKEATAKLDALSERTEQDQKQK